MRKRSSNDYRNRKARTKEIGNLWCSAIDVEYVRTVMDDGFDFYSPRTGYGYARVNRDGRINVIVRDKTRKEQ